MVRPGDGRRFGVQAAGLEQALHHERHAAGGVEIRGDVAAAGLEIADERRGRGDPVEVVDLERHAHLASDREQMQHAVGRAAAAGDCRDRVLEALARDDLARALAAAQDVHDELARVDRGLELLAVLRRDHARSHRRDAERLEGHGHRVGGELPAAGAGAGRCHALELVQVFLGDLARGMRADGFEDLLDRHLLSAAKAGRSSRRRAYPRGRAGRGP
jgi:hypothetical protein